MGIWVFSQFRAVMTSAARNILVCVFWQTNIHISLGDIIRVEFLGCRICIYYIFFFIYYILIGIAEQFSKVAQAIHTSTGSAWEFRLFCIFANT